MQYHSDVGIINNTKTGTGLGVYVNELLSHMPENESVDNIVLDYNNQQILSGRDGIVTKVRKYPHEYKYIWYLRAKKYLPKCKLYHISNQNLSFLNLRPQIVTCYDVFHISHPRSTFHKLFGQWAYSGLKNAEHIIAGSEYTKRMILKYYKIDPRNITVVYAGVSNKFRPLSEVDIDKNTLNQKYGLDNYDKIILHVSNEQPHKNVSSIIEALHTVKNKHKFGDFHLLKAGNPQYIQDNVRHRKMVRDLHLEDKVTFCGYIPETDLVKLYNVSDLFVFPSLHEGFGLPVLEAMACGCPVIASNTTSLPEVVGNAGVMVNPYSVDELATAIFELLSDKDRSEDQVRLGTEWAKQFTWEKCALETAKIYEWTIN
ncbi:MAG TPA: hypothetical protein DCX03_11040 [Bacteroidales bacterium]|nr:hypothetical protein [Bacteroidales bacterium]